MPIAEIAPLTLRAIETTIFVLIQKMCYNIASPFERKYRNMDAERAEAALGALPRLDIDRIDAILVDCLGETDTAQNPLPGCELVDVYIMQLVYKTDKVHEYAAEMIELLKLWDVSATLVGLPSLGEEINYMAAGVILADQRRALMLFAFGKMLEWWDILDPQTMLGLPRDMPLGRMLAGAGMVSIMGYRV